MDQWRAVLARPAIPLDEGALVIAAHAAAGSGVEDFDVAAELSRLDDLASSVVEPSADGVCRLLFSGLGLRGNIADYDDPRNSFLDHVLDRRLGIPISLSVVLIEVGRRCGVAFDGIGMPGHFLVRDRERPDVLIDAFGAGRRLDRAGCRALLERVTGSPVAIEPLTAPSSPPAGILARMLANLDRCYRGRADAPSLLWISRLRAALPDRPVGEQAKLATQLAELGALRDAADLFEELAERPGLAPESATRLHHRAVAARAVLN